MPYYGSFETTVGGACWDGSDYGVAILLRTSSFTYLNGWWLPNPGNNEPRKLMCLQTTVAGASQPLVTCVTHIDYHSANIAAQVSYVASITRDDWSGHKVFVGGDFNTTPATSAMNPMYSTLYPGGTGIFYEADASNYVRTGGGLNTTDNEYTGGCGSYPCGYQQLFNPTKKIDYVFLSRYDFVSYSADATYALHSDHTPLWVTATIT